MKGVSWKRPRSSGFVGGQDLGLGFKIQVLGFKEFGVQDLGYRVQYLRFGAQDFEFKI